MAGKVRQIPYCRQGAQASNAGLSKFCTLAIRNGFGCFAFGNTRDVRQYFIYQYRAKSKVNIHFTTERLNIRPISERDIENVFTLQSLEETAKFNTSQIPKDIHETNLTVKEWIKGNNEEPTKKFTFKVELIEQNQFVGLIGINLGKERYKNAEIWFQYDFKYWNKGYATESARRIIDFGFENLKLHRIEAGCAVDNVGSINVLEKVGMIREAHTRQLLPLKYGWSDNYGYAMLSTDLRT